MNQIECGLEGHTSDRFKVMHEAIRRARGRYADLNARFAAVFEFEGGEAVGVGLVEDVPVPAEPITKPGRFQTGKFGKTTTSDRGMTGQ